MSKHKVVIGILVCNSPEVLNHKLKDGKRKDNRYCYWEMAKTPTRIRDIFSSTIRTGDYSVPIEAPGESWIYEEDDVVFPAGFEVRLYFATIGTLRGYFVCNAMSDNDSRCVLRFFSDDWHPCFPVAIRPSQGWRYWEAKS